MKLSKMTHTTILREYDIRGIADDDLVDENNKLIKMEGSLVRFFDFVIKISFRLLLATGTLYSLYLYLRQLLGF